MLTVIFSVGRAGVGGGEEKLEGIKVREGYFWSPRSGKLGVEELAETFKGLFVVKSLANGFREDLGESFSAATNTSSVLSLCKKESKPGLSFRHFTFLRRLLPKPAEVCGDEGRLRRIHKIQSSRTSGLHKSYNIRTIKKTFFSHVANNVRDWNQGHFSLVHRQNTR